MLCDFHPHRRQLKHLPSLLVAGGHRLQRGPTVPTTLDGVEVEVVRLGHGVQRMALVAWLLLRLFCPSWSSRAFTRAWRAKMRVVNTSSTASTASSPCT